MAQLIELISYETKSHVTLKRAAIEEIVPVGDTRADVRFDSGRTLAVAGEFREVARAIGTFLEFRGEREGTLHLINAESVELVEQTSEGWCRLSMRSGRNYYVQGERMEISLKIELAGAAATPAPAREPADVITADFVGHRRLRENFPASLGSRTRALQ